MAQESTTEIRHVTATVHGRILVKAPASAPGAALVGFHGYAEGAAVHLERMMAIPGAGEWLVVSVQALNRFYRGRSAETVASWMTREDRTLAIDDNIAYVDGVLREIDREWSPGRPVVLAGFSQGVAMAFRAALRGGRRVRGVIAVGADVPPEIIADPGRPFPPVLLIRGERDEWYTDAKFAADQAGLARHSAPVTALTVAAGHEWTAEVSEAAGRFVAALLYRSS